MPPKPRAAETKRIRATDTAAATTAVADEDRSVRQRRESSSAAAAAPSSIAAQSSAVSSSSFAASSAPAGPRPSLMRLAVVERQLIMQALDIKSLSRLASTCRQMRAEALHREAGRFIPEPLLGSALFKARFIDRDHPAHASPLFRKHVPVSLSFGSYRDVTVKTVAEFEALMDQAASFSRIAELRAANNDWWTDDRMIRVLSMPSMQDVRRVLLKNCPNWFNSPRVQTALLSLPRLQDCILSVEPTVKLSPSTVALALHLASFRVHVDRDHAASVRALRAMSLAPALVRLVCCFYKLQSAEPVLAELIWCLPPTLTELMVVGLSVPRNLPRPLAKALFSHTPLLQTLSLRGSVEVILRGLLDAGLPALPMLRRVRFRDVFPAHFSFDQDPDPIPPLLRRFLHRFPQVSVRMYIYQEAWHDLEQLSTIQVRYLSWPRVELYWADTYNRIGAPPSPHASDDEDDSDVEELVDPGLDADDQEN